VGFINAYVNGNFTFVDNMGSSIFCWYLQFYFVIQCAFEANFYEKCLFLAYV
jgi:hypothetical protein